MGRVDVNFKKISQFEGPKESLGFLMWQVSTKWRSFLEKSLKPLNLTHPQFVVLASIGWLTKEGHNTHQVAVGQMAQLDPNTISQILKGLEKKNLIKRIPSQDARAKDSLLTLMGGQLLKKALPLIEKRDEEFFEHLNRGEQRQLLHLFHKLLHDKKKEIDK